MTSLGQVKEDRQSSISSEDGERRVQVVRGVKLHH